jgi:opacity protein-like surface antigen
MKRWLPLFMLTILAVILASSTGYSQYRPGTHTIGVNATVVTEPVGWGVNYEFGYDDNLGLGLIVRYWSPEDRKAYESTGEASIERETYMAQLQAVYHALPTSAWDPYGGIRLGYSYYGETFTTTGIVVGITQPEAKAESGITLSLVAGMRYYVSEQLSVGAALEYFLFNDENYFENESTTGMMFDLSFTLR